VTRLDAVFLDRDGTINVKATEGAYITDPSELVLLPGAAAAVRRLNEADIPVLLVTNQRCIARGLLSEAGYAAVARRLRDLLARAGAWLDAEYVCPHAGGDCACRKPLPGLLRQAAADRPGLRLDWCALVGDAESDVAAARAVGVLAARLGPAETETAADVTVRDLAAAVDLLLAADCRPAAATQ
jgi:D-glycero-D-manno-heptose 1,7-bisphosphate phosphatase